MEDDNKIPLNEKQERFCYEYCVDFNATQAAIRAGYSEKTARSIASENLTKPNIQLRIKEMQEKLAETAGISALKIVKEHEKIAFSSISHLHNTWIEKVDFEKLSEEQKASIKSISTKVQKKNIGTREEPEIIDVEFIKVELYDKQKSLDSLTNILGYNSPQKIDSNVNLSQPMIIEKTYEAVNKTDDSI